VSATADSGVADAHRPRGHTARGVLARIGVAMHGDVTVPRVTTLPLRLYLASAFILEVKNKIGPGKWTAWLEWMPTDITDQVQHVAGFYRPFLTAIVLPHATLFGALVALGEAGVSIALLIGGLTRLAAAVGILLTANYALLNGTSLTAVSNDRALLVGFIVVLLTAPGRVFGVDAYLARRWPRSILW
jgi:uncharacterized membrane protein YphA (DoxX/SURF4 family)